MYKTVAESVETALALKSLVANANHCEVIIAPVFTSLKTVADRLEGSNINVAAQNCSTQIEQGAHTGEITANMIKDVGCSHVIIGHSERRQFYGDTDQTVSLKVRAALDSNLSAIVCVGEMLEQRDSGKAETVVEEQLKGSLADLTVTDLARIIIAYEPVWAIGTGRTASPEQAQEMHAFIRRVFAERHSNEAAKSLRILYGGSVKPDNISGLMSCEDIDGALVGGASLNADSFAQIVNYNR